MIFIKPVFLGNFITSVDKVKYAFWISILVALFVGTVDFRLGFYYQFPEQFVSSLFSF